jgi:hypothetical protein
MKAITTIKGYRNNVAPHMIRTNATPWLRLHFFRTMAAVHGGDWRKARAAMHAPEVSALSPGYNSKDYGVRTDRYPVMVTYDGPQFRGEEWADECEGSGLDHRGWYSDADCSRTLRAFVFDLPHGRYGCGYADSDSGERVYLLEVHATVRDAAASADHEAQHYAEQEKEYNERWQAAQDARREVRECEERLRAYLSARNDTRTAARELAEMELSILRDLRKDAAQYADIEE